jgi:hypothetical protein
VGSTISRRKAFNAATVPISSNPISREYPRHQPPGSPPTAFGPAARPPDPSNDRSIKAYSAFQRPQNLLLPWSK